MDISKMTKLVIPNYTFIGGIIPKNEVTLLAGLPGTGKTYSLIKFLNSENIIPIHVNLDYSPIGNLRADQYGKELVQACLITKDIEGIENHVIIFDTYQRVSEILDYDDSQKSKEKIAKAFEDLAHNFKCTVIVIGHPEDYVGKDGVFKDNKYLARNCAEYIYMDSILPRGKTGNTEDIGHKTVIKKGRGNGGERIIDNWMR
jgi:predicted ATP-dependent serine protease